MATHLSFEELLDLIKSKGLSNVKSLPIHVQVIVQNNKDRFDMILKFLSRKKIDQGTIYKLQPQVSKNFYLPIQNDNIRKKLKISNLNVTQRFILQYIHHQSNIVISAPTGCGKTIMALLFMLDAFGISTDDSVKLEKSKNLFSPIVVYLAPHKALITQIYQKISQYFPDTLLLTSDTADSFKPCSVLITTPERYLFLLLRLKLRPKLLVIDEVHGLGSSRGQTLEMIISMTKCLNNSDISKIDESNDKGVQLSQSKTRTVALSATIPNLNDIAEYLDAIPIFFSESYRPVQLSKYLVLLSNEPDSKINTSKNSEKKYKLFEPTDIFPIIEPLLDRNGKTVVFIRARKNVEAFYKLFSEMTDEKMKSEDKMLYLFHHSGLKVEQRRAVEQKFIKTKKNVILFSTSTLAWGIDLPIDTVFVLDEFDEIDIVQMMGRAGRGIFLSDKNSDEQSKDENIEQAAYFITRKKDNLQFFLSLKPLESQVESLKNFMLLSIWMQFDLIKWSFWNFQKIKNSIEIVNGEPEIHDKWIKKNESTSGFCSENDTQKQQSEKDSAFDNYKVDFMRSDFHPHQLSKYSKLDYLALIVNHLIIGHPFLYHVDFLDHSENHQLIKNNQIGAPLTYLSIPAIIMTFYQIKPEIAVKYMKNLKNLISSSKIFDFIEDDTLTDDVKKDFKSNNINNLTFAVIRNIHRHLWCIFHFACFYDHSAVIFSVLAIFKQFENNSDGKDGKTKNIECEIILRADDDIEKPPKENEIYAIVREFESYMLPKGKFIVKNQIYTSDNPSELKAGCPYQIKSTADGKTCNILILTNKFSHFCSYQALKERIPNSYTVDDFVKKSGRDGPIAIKEIKMDEFLSVSRNDIAYLIGTQYLDEQKSYKWLKIGNILILEE
ncbi:RNA helicase BRR2, DEAD-box superfamily, partial [Pseudoloma neurophilia]